MELFGTSFQTSVNYTAGYDNCNTIADIVDANKGFVGPCCTKGATWSAELSCAGHSYERYSVASYRGTWSCDTEAEALMAVDDASSDGTKNAKPETKRNAFFKRCHVSR